MLGTGFLAGLIAKLTGLGSVAKVAVATTTAALTVAVAGGAAGVLPLPGSPSGPTVTVTTEPVGTVDATAPVTTSDDAAPPAGDDGSVAPPAGSASAAAGAGVTAESPSGSIPPVTGPPVAIPGGGALPDLSGLTQVPTQVLACITPAIDLVKGIRSPADLAQLSQLGPTIVGCVTDIVSDLPLPFGMNTCVANIMAFVRNIISQVPGRAPDLGSFNVAACIPAGLPVPTGLPGMPFMGGGFPFGS